jgi:NADPH2:quinone reductase
MEMRVFRLYEYGGPEKMALEEVPTPALGPGQVLVRVEAAGVNFNDIYQRSGQFRPVPLPVSLGQEGAGVVEAAGPGAHDRPGDRVAWCGDHNGGCGSYATHALLQSEWLVPLPSSLNFEQGAGAAMQGVAAHAMTHSVYPVKPGDLCLVHSVAGGSGLLIGQMARMRGAWVIGTVSTEAKKRVALETGAADEVISYDDFDVKVRTLTGGRGVNVAYDHIGVTTLERTYNCLAPRAMLVYYGMSRRRVPPFDLNRLPRTGSQFVTRPTMFDYLESREERLERSRVVFGWIASGTIKLRIDHRYPLEQAPDAQVALAERRTTGKIILLPRA